MSKVIIDARGREIPESLIDPIKLKRHKTVEAIFRDIDSLEKTIKTKKAKIMEKVAKYVAYKESKTDVITSTKGNLTLTNITGNKQVEFVMRDTLVFNDLRLEAEAVFFECVEDYSADAKEELITIFKTVFNMDKKGKVDIAGMRRVKSLNLKHPDWPKFKDLLDRAEEVEGTKQYLNIKRRDNSEGKFKTVNLNFSSI